MPTDENLKQKWLQALQGLECGSSNCLCINHFNQADIKKKGNRFVLDKNAVPNFERENLSKNIGDDDDNEAIDEDEDRDYGGESSASHTHVQQLPLSEPNELEYNEDTTSTSMYDASSCDECKKLAIKVRTLEQQITDIKTLHSVEILKMNEKLLAQKEGSKKHVQEKKNLKRLLTYHKSKELKLQEVVGSIHDENLISNEAAADLNVIP